MKIFQSLGFEKKGVPVEMMEHHMGSCALNPKTLKEKTHTLTGAAVKKHIAVIGGAITGIEIARLQRSVTVILRAGISASISR